MNALIPGVLLALFVSVASGQPAAPGTGGPAQPKPDRYVLVHAGTLLAVPGTKPQSQMTVVIKNDRIASIEKGYLQAADAGRGGSGTDVEVIDLSDRFVLPGLMDAHVHLQAEPSLLAPPRGTR